MSASEDPEAKAATAALVEIGEAWIVLLRSDGISAKPRRQKTTAQASVVIPLARHVHEIVTELAPLLPRGVTLPYAPMVRMAFESTVRAAWFDSDAATVESAVNEEYRQQANLRRTIDGVRGFEALAQSLTENELLRTDTTYDVEARHVQSMLGGDGTQLYGLYRLLCRESHPSMRVAAHYLERSPDDRIVLRRDPDDAGAAVGRAWLLACCYVWSTRVLTFYTRDDALRSVLRRHARALGIADALAHHRPVR